jgi:hypothetical protein
MNIFCSQGELEHRKPKSWYCRTSKKKFVRQLTQIERRRTRIRLIRQRKMSELSGAKQKEFVADSPEAHHHIGTAENNPEHIGSFLRLHTGDPAVKVGFNAKEGSTQLIF